MTTAQILIICIFVTINVFLICLLIEEIVLRKQRLSQQIKEMR